MVRVLVMMAVVAWGAVARSAEIELRDRVELSGSVVRLGDIAHVSSELDSESARLAAIPLTPAPAPGADLYLSAAQVRDLLAAIGVDMSRTTFRGSASIAIHAPAVALTHAAAAEGVDPPTRESAAADLAASITRYLQAQTGHDLWNVTLGVDSPLGDQYRLLGPNPAVTGGRAPWTGRQRFELCGAAGQAPVRVFATVERLELAAFAVRAIAAGDLVRATDVSLRAFPGSVSGQAATSLEAVVGKEATQAIRAGAMLTTAQVRAPLLVRRGERVTVRARAGTVVVRTYATAQQDGSLGDLIVVQVLEGKERFAARVAGLRELEVFAAGTDAAEVVAATR